MDTVHVNMADGTINTTNSQPYVEFSDFKRTGQVIILGKTVQTKDVVLVGLLIVCAIVIIALIPLSTGIHITQAAPEACDTVECVEVAGSMAATRNSSVNPCDNFYEYSCGRWWTWHYLTPDKVQRTVRGDIQGQNKEMLRSILESDVVNDTDWSTERKLKDFFRSCLDQVHRNQKGGRAFLDQIVNKTGGWTVLGTYSEQAWDLNANLKKVHVDFWTDVLFKLNVGTDWNDNKKNVIEIDLGGLGLPWMQYVRNDESAGNTRDAYKQYIRKAGELLAADAGLSVSDSTISGRLSNFVTDVWDVELGLANITQHTLPTNNPHDDDQRLTLDELNQQAGGEILDWKSLIMYAFQGAGVTASTKVVLLEKDYIFQLGQYLKDMERNHYLDDTKRMMNNYFTWRMLETYMPGLSEPYYKAQQEFRHLWTGVDDHPEVWETCFNWVADHLPEGLGALFVQKGLAKEYKDDIDGMFQKIRQMMINRLDAISWMDDATKAVGKDKLQKVQDKLGYPDLLLNHDYIDKLHDTLTVNRNDFFGNLLSVSMFTRQDLNRQLVSADNRDMWRVKMWQVHAEFYNPWNELLVPAGFMRFPVYAPWAPAYFSWAGLGAALSKQLVYGVDETGGFYAPNGTVVDWWSRNTSNQFLTARQCLIDYYNTLEAGPYQTKSSGRGGKKVRIRGSYYARDAVADIGGLRNAYNVWKDVRTTIPDLKVLPGLGLNTDQLFFLSYAQNYCFNRRDDAAYEMVRDGFVPEDIRVNAALRQFEDFARVFECPAGSPMTLSERCDVF